MITALLVVLVSLAVFTAFDASSRASGRTRAQVVASNLAQQDQERMRGMRPSELMSYSPAARQVTEGKIPYTVSSTGNYVLTPSTNTGCTSRRRDDYIRIVSTVSFPGQDGLRPVRVESLVSPPIGGANPGQGSLALQIAKADGVTPVVALPVTLTGSLPINTGSEGCVFFANFPVAAYTLSYGMTGWVDPAGTQAISIPTTIADQQTTSLSRSYDRAGTVNSTFWTHDGTTYVASAGTTVSLFHTGVPVRGGYTTGTSGTPVAGITVGSLFPFTTPYTAFSGSCTTNANLPAPLLTSLTTAGYGQAVTVPAGGSVAAKVFEPAINPLVRYRATSGGAFAAVTGARVFVTSTDATCPSVTQRTTVAGGRLTAADRGFPYGSYSVCVDYLIPGRTFRRRLTLPATNGVLSTNLAFDIPYAPSGSADQRCAP